MKNNAIKQRTIKESFLLFLVCGCFPQPSRVKEQGSGQDASRCWKSEVAVHPHNGAGCRDLLIVRICANVSLQSCVTQAGPGLGLQELALHSPAPTSQWGASQSALQLPPVSCDCFSLIHSGNVVV